MLDYIFGLFSHDLAIDLGHPKYAYFAPEAYSLALAKGATSGRAEVGGLQC